MDLLIQEGADVKAADKVSFVVELGTCILRSLHYKRIQVAGWHWVANGWKGIVKCESPIHSNQRVNVDT